MSKAWRFMSLSPWLEAGDFLSPHGPNPNGCDFFSGQGATWLAIVMPAADCR
jgi:hypothetical protein